MAWALRDAAVNRRFAKAERRFLVTRHPAMHPRFYDVILDWLAARVPEVRGRFELGMLPLLDPDLGRFVLHVPWLQDPVQRWSPRAYDQAIRLTARFDRRGVPTVNRVERLLHASKSEGARRMAEAGVRTPRTIPIADPDLFRRTLLGLEPPLLLRDDWEHAPADALRTGRVVRCDSAAEARAVDLSRFARPVAMEFVETRDPRDGLFRKYRCVVAGGRSVPHHLLVQEHWFVKGQEQLYSEAIRDEDVAYLSAPDPNHALFRRARESLGLDVVSFDYGYDREGRPVVFEANPYAFFHFLDGRRAYRRPAVERTFAAIVSHYHAVARLPEPPDLAPLLPAGAEGAA